MAHIYVANGTHHNQQFEYRVPAQPEQVFTLHIPPGGQNVFPHEFDETQATAVIEQLERFGAVRHSEVTAITQPKALVYRVTKAIGSDEIDEARVKDKEARQEQAAQQLENNGLAQFENAAKHGIVNETSMEVRQLEDQGSEPVKGGVDFEVGVSPKAQGRTEGRRRSR